MFIPPRVIVMASIFIALLAIARYRDDLRAKTYPLLDVTKGMSSEKPVDVLILGGSYAGLAAAATLYRHQHTMLIFDHKRPRDKWRTPIAANPGHQGDDPEVYRTRGRKEILRTGLARIVNEEILGIIRQNDTSFSVTDGHGRTYYGRKLLLAMGGLFEWVEIDGYQELFPGRIFHCLFTFGYERRNSSDSGILAKAALENPFHIATLIQDSLKLARQVTVFTDGNKKFAREVEALLDYATLHAVKIENRQIARFSPGIEATQVAIHFTDGNSMIVDFIVSQPKVTAPTWIVNTLGLELDMMQNIKTNGIFYKTNVPGVSAAGDCASPMKMIPNALLMGANAAAGLARELPISVTGNSAGGFHSLIGTQSS